MVAGFIDAQLQGVVASNVNVCSAATIDFESLTCTLTL